MSLCMGCRHAHFCTNDYQYAYWFSSWIFLYEWLSIFFFNEFSSCTFLYEWLSISFWIGFPHAHIFTNDYPFLCSQVFVMHISVRMTIHILIEWVFVMHISVRMTIHFFVHGFPSCTFLYEWLSIFICVFFMNISVRLTIQILFEWFFVVHISVRMTIHFSLNGFSSCTFLYEELFCPQISFQCVSVKDPHHHGVLYDDWKRHHTVLKYMSYGVNFWQTNLVYQEGISRIILWKCLFLANCIVRNQQL